MVGEAEGVVAGDKEMGFDADVEAGEESLHCFQVIVIQMGDKEADVDIAALRCWNGQYIYVKFYTEDILKKSKNSYVENRNIS